MKAILIVPLLIASACTAQSVHDLASLVNPFVGTSPSPSGAAGNTHPGATRPFGMLYWGPDPVNGRYYRYDDTSTRGFSLTHLSGTGCPHPAFGDAPILPILGTPVEPISAQQAEYNAGDQVAEPGYYAVKLSSGIQVQLAAAVRSGIAEIRFPTGGGAHTILMDLSQNLTYVTDAEVQVQGQTITGSVASGRFCNKKNQYRLYFVLQVDETPTNAGNLQRSSSW